MLQTASHTIWKNWAKKLQQLGLQDFAATLFKSTGPLNIIGAQLIYLGQPILNTFVRNENLSALAELLEEPKNTKLFFEALNEERQ